MYHDYQIYNIPKYRALYNWDKANRPNRWYWSPEDIYHYLNDSPFSPWTEVEKMVLSVFFDTLKALYLEYKAAQNKEREAADVVWERNAAKALQGYLGDIYREMKKYKPDSKQPVISRVRKFEFEVRYRVINGNHNDPDDPEYAAAAKALAVAKDRYHSYIEEHEVAILELLGKCMNPATRKLIKTQSLY